MIEQFSRSGKLQILLKTIGTDPKKYLDEEIVQYVDRFQPSQNCKGLLKDTSLLFRIFVITDLILNIR